MMGTDASYTVDKVGVFRPKKFDVAELAPGEGRLHHRPRSRKWPIPRVGDTITEEKAPLRRICCRASKPVQPVVFCGLFPVDAGEFDDLRNAMGRLRLNDASFSFEMESSAALGFGFRCGFPSGLLHLEIVQERLSREFDLDLISDRAVGCLQADHARRHRAGICTNPADMPRRDEDRACRGTLDSAPRS